MIPARKFPIGQWLVWRLIDGSFRKHFDRIFLRLQGEGGERQPLLLCANHATWWDGYIATLIERHMGVDGYLMMEEAQLKRYFFFAWAGCFSVNRQDARSALQSLKYGAHLLKERPGRMVYIFPQGEIQPNDRRPLVFYSGAAYLARLAAPLQIRPVATRIEYLAEQRPDLFISVGTPVCIEPEEARQPDFLKSCTARMEMLVTAELDALRDDLLARDLSSFTPIMHGRSSTNRIFDMFFMRKQIRRQ